MRNIPIKSKDGKKGVMSIRENEVNKIVHFVFEDGSEDSIVYLRYDTDDDIVKDLHERHGYLQLDFKNKKIIRCISCGSTDNDGVMCSKCGSRMITDMPL